MMKLKSTLLLILLMLGMTFDSATAAETAGQVLDRASSAFVAANSITANFNMKGSQGSTSGTFYYGKGRYSVVSGAASVWYNGKTLWTYNPRTNETTIMTPTKQEVAENNPFSIVGSLSRNFNAAYAKKQGKGTIVLVLLPKSAKSGIKKCILTLDKRRLTPLRLQINDGRGTTTVNVTKYVVTGKMNKSLFEYPAKKYAGAEIVDLR